MKDIIVIDLDGTLADIEHRLPLVNCDKPDYDEFHRRCVDDKVSEWCLALLRVFHNTAVEPGYDPTYKVMIVTARNPCVKRETEWWLADAGVPADVEIVFVREGEKQIKKDEAAKRDWLHKSGLKDRILFVVDDRQRVVDMWRQEGLKCLQCNAWLEWKGVGKVDLPEAATGSITELHD